MKHKNMSSALKASPLAHQSKLSGSVNAFSAKSKASARDSKKLDEDLLRVKNQVGKLMEQARLNAAKNKGAKNPVDLEKAKALESLVAGVNQVITSLEKLR